MEAVFGALSWSEKSFPGVGIRHAQLEDGTVELDQDDYIEQLTPVSGPILYGRPPEEASGPELRHAFRSLLGAVAYSLITQHWISVYIVALQRKSQEVVRALKKTKAKVVLQSMEC